MKVSSKPRKVRKRQLYAPLHRRLKLLGAHLAPDLRQQYGTRSMPVRKGDRVRVMRGDFAGHEDEVTEVDLDRGVVYVKDVTTDKVDGTKAFIPIKASNLEITRLNLEDERRQKILQRRGLP